MTLGDLDFKIRLLQNFQINYDRTEGEFRTMMLSQSRRVIAEIKTAIKNGEVTAQDAGAATRLHKVGRIIKLAKAN